MSNEREQIDLEGTSRAMQGLEEEFGSYMEDINSYTETETETTPTNQSNEELLYGETEAQTTPEAAVEQTTETQATEETSSDVVTNPIFGDQNLATQETTEKAESLTDTNGNTEINSFAGFDSLLNEVGVKDANELKSKIEHWKNAESTVESVDNALNSLSPELYAAMQANLRGEDWRGVLQSTPSLDFTKNADQIEAKDLVEAFMPGQFNSDDWEEYSDEHGDPNVKRAINLALNVSKEKFVSKQTELRSSAEVSQKQQAEKTERFNSSLQRANDYLKAKMPGIDQNYLSKLNTKITKEGITNHFYNEDGTLKETAAEAFLRSTDEYEQLVQIRINNAVKEAKNQAVQEMLDRGASIPTQRTRTNSSTEEIRPEVKKKLNEIDDLMS